MEKRPVLRWLWLLTVTYTTLLSRIVLHVRCVAVSMEGIQILITCCVFCKIDPLLTTLLWRFVFYVRRVTVTIEGIQWLYSFTTICLVLYLLYPFYRRKYFSVYANFLWNASYIWKGRHKPLQLDYHSISNLYNLCHSFLLYQSGLLL